MISSKKLQKPRAIWSCDAALSNTASQSPYSFTCLYPHLPPLIHTEPPPPFPSTNFPIHLFPLSSSHSPTSFLLLPQPLLLLLPQYIGRRRPLQIRLASLRSKTRDRWAETPTISTTSAGERNSRPGNPLCEVGTSGGALGRKNRGYCKRDGGRRTS